MNCEQIELQLSEFLDRLLDSEGSKSVREHLALCPRCSEELAGLAECRRLVASLPAVEPPTGLVMQVMNEIRRDTVRPGFFRRWFEPIHFNLPIQATAVASIAVLSIYLYQKADLTDSPLAPTASERSPGVEQGAFESGAAIQSPALPEKGKETAEPERAAERQAADRKDAISRERMASKVTARSAGAMSNASESGPVESRLHERPEKFKSAPIPAQGVAVSQDGPVFSGDFGDRGLAFPMDALRQFGIRPVPPPGERLFSLQQEPIPDYELVVRRRQLPRAEQPNRSGNDSLQREAQSVGSKSSEPRKQADVATQGNPPVEVLWFTVPYDRYEQFKKELAAQSVVESEIPVAVKEKEPSFIADRPLSIKVRVLPAAQR